MDRELLKGSTSILLLSLLSEEAMYGYQIIQAVLERSKGAYLLKDAAVYPALRKLEAAGFVRSAWKQGEGGRDRCYYEILPAGLELLEEKKAEWLEFVELMEGIVPFASRAPHAGSGTKKGR